MNRVEQLALQRRRQAEKMASRLQGLYPLAVVTHGTEEQRKGPAVMRVRVNYESETYLVSAVVSIHFDGTFGAVVVATTYNPVTDTLQDAINVGRDVLYSVSEALGFVESALNNAFRQVA